MARRQRSHKSTPLHLGSMWSVDQVFLVRRGERIEVISSMVNDKGSLRNLSFIAPTTDPIKAVRYAAQHVAGQGNVSGARQARLRWAREQVVTEHSALIRDYELEDEYLDAFEETLAAIRDQQR